MRKRSTIVFALVLCCGMNHSAIADQQDKAWWLTPQRLLQTNLREIDVTMDVDQYVREVQDFGANIVLFNVGGIVANYPTDLEFHWRNTIMEGDLVGRVLPKLHAANIKMMGRFDFSKLNEKVANQHPEWLYVSEAGEHVNYNGQVHTCLMGGYQQGTMFNILEEAVTRYPLDAVFFNMIGFPQQVVNGAWLDFYCIGPLQRLEDRGGIEAVSGIYQFHRDNEAWMLNTVSAAEVGLVRHDGDDYWGWVQILSENHVPFDLVSFEH